jgi:hypothetical protein
MRLDDTALRVAIDLRDAYEASLSLWREIDELDGPSRPSVADRRSSNF